MGRWARSQRGQQGRQGPQPLLTCKGHKPPLPKEEEQSGSSATTAVSCAPVVAGLQASPWWWGRCKVKPSQQGAWLGTGTSQQSSGKSAGYQPELKYSSWANGGSLTQLSPAAWAQLTQPHAIRADLEHKQPNLRGLGWGCRAYWRTQGHKNITVVNFLHLNVYTVTFWSLIMPCLCCDS